MKKNTPNIRESDILFGGKDLEQLYIFKKFPIFIGCVNKNSAKDIYYPMKWDISKTTGVIQLRKPPPSNMIYSAYHSEAVGQTWKKHNNRLVKLVLKYGNGEILEIGGSNGKFAKIVISSSKKIKNWTILEPNPTKNIDKKIKVIKTLFNEKIGINNKYDTIVHSHTLEHFYSPFTSLKKIHNLLKQGGVQIFSVPNLYAWLKRDMPNALNFEHSIFLTEYFIDKMLAMTGFRITKKQKMGEHSIFYVTKRIEKFDSSKVKIRNRYKFYKKMYLEFILRSKKLTKILNKEIDNFSGPIYLFGAHIFSQFLLNIGLHKSKIVMILDNSSLKQGQRLYGTRLKVGSPDILKGKKNAMVILRTGLYTKEIKDQILNINPHVKIVV